MLPAPCCLCACCTCACRTLHAACCLCACCMLYAACAHAARAHVAVTCACLMLPTACCTCTCRCNVRRYENDGIFDKFRCSWSPDSRYFVTGSYSNLYDFLPPSLRKACSDVYICNHRRCRLHCMITSPKHSLRAKPHVRRVHACVCNGRCGRMRLRPLCGCSFTVIDRNSKVSSTLEATHNPTYRTVRLRTIPLTARSAYAQSHLPHGPPTHNPT